jgi:hypothetical protein
MGGQGLTAVEQAYLDQARRMQALSFVAHIPLLCFGIALPVVIPEAETLGGSRPAATGADRALPVSWPRRADTNGTPCGPVLMPGSTQPAPRNSPVGPGMVEVGKEHS